jgi:hypothetical protein
MDAELIELSDIQIPLPQAPRSASPNFGGGIELLMNTNDTKSGGSSGSGSGGSGSFEELKNLENELNNLISDSEPPPASSSFSSSSAPMSLRFDDTPDKSFPSSSSSSGSKLISSTDIATPTWDGYSKISSTVNPDNVQPATHVMTKEELMREKFKYLRKLETLEGKGVSLTKKYNMDTPLCEMQGEYEMILEEKAKHNSIKFQSNMLMAMVNGIEFLNNKFDPFDVKLDGWSEQINENLSDYDDVFGELHEKYKNRASLAPELKLLFQLAGSGLMIHMTNTMFKSSMPGMDDILRQNPDLMRQFQNAAVKTMSETSPGFSGFVNSVTSEQQQQPQFQEGYRPGNNNASSSNVPKTPIRSMRPEMKGPSDINDILSGLKTRTISVENTNSNISLPDAKDMFSDKKSKRRVKSERNTVSLDI